MSEADAALRSLAHDMDLIPLPLSLYIRCHKVFYLVCMPPSFFLHHVVETHQVATNSTLQGFANRVIGEAAWEAKEYGKGLGYLIRASKLFESCQNDVLEALGDPHCESLGRKVRKIGVEVLSLRDTYQKANDSIYYERILHTDENLPLGEPFAAMQVKEFDLLQSIDAGMLLAFK